MQYKTNKLKAIEKQRKSILTENLSKCYLCYMHADDMHEIYAGSNRRTSMLNDFCVPLCRTHHRLVQTNKMYGDILKRECQAKFEETHSRQEFLNIIGKNYL